MHLFPESLLSSQVIKEIKGQKYIYEVKWNPDEKRQIWTYEGKIGQRKSKDLDKKKLKKDLYHVIKNDTILRISKRDLKRVRNLIDKVIDTL